MLKLWKRAESNIRYDRRIGNFWTVQQAWAEWFIHWYYLAHIGQIELCRQYSNKKQRITDIQKKDFPV